MIINFTLGLTELDDKKKIFLREAIRGIIIKNGLLLLVQTNKGDYKLPGGGMKSHENHKEALIREISEETGYRVLNIKNKIGEVIEQQIDSFENDAYFKMISHYYLAQVNDEVGEQDLDNYEKEQDFTAKLVKINDAIEHNEKVIAENPPDMNSWIYRETLVLKELSNWFQEL